VASTPMITNSTNQKPSIKIKTISIISSDKVILLANKTIRWGLAINNIKMILAMPFPVKKTFNNVIQTTNIVNMEVMVALIEETESQL
jgi:hypothetical protein